MNQHTIRILSLTSLLALNGFAAAQTTSRLSETLQMQQPGNADSGRAYVSADGRYVAFESEADNLVAGDTNGVSDVFIRDLVGGWLHRVSISTGDVQADGASGVHGVAVSANGDFVAFASRANNFVAGHTGAFNDIFVRDRGFHRTAWVSVNKDGVEANGDSEWPSISADGRYVVFQSTANDLVAGDAAWTDVFVRDTVANTTTRVSVDPQGGSANAHAIVGAGAISADGRFVVFSSVASNLVAGDTNGMGDIFVRDMQSGTTQRVSLGLGGAQANAMSYQPAISANGRHVIFRSDASNLVAGDTNAMGDVFTFDRNTGVTERVSVASDGTQGNFLSGLDAVSISLDGRFACFASFATNLVPFDTNNMPDVFVHDSLTGVTERVSVHLAGAQSNGACEGASMSRDGQVIAFWSSATTLVDGPSGGSRHVYAHNRADFDVVGYCTGSQSANGCTSVISGLGFPTVSGNVELTLLVTDIDAGRQGMIFYGIDNTAFAPTPWGSGFLCVKAPLQRTPIQTTFGEPFSCAGEILLNWSDYMTSHPSALGNPLQVGKHFYAQGWHRDPGSPNHGALSNALAFAVQP